MKKKFLFIILFGTILCSCGNEKETLPAQTMEKSESVTVPVSVTDATETFEIAYSSVVMKKPSWEYYIAKQITSDTKPYQLTLLEEKPNQIVDTEEWFVENELDRPDRAVSLDERYDCTIHTDDRTLTVNKSGEYGAELDFSSYMYANETNQTENSILEEPLGYAVIEEELLYVSNYHSTYAQSEPLNAYITAISLEDFSVLWRTAPLTCNSDNFVVIGDVIFCAYGFTSEDDMLYQLDKKTGEVLASTPLKSMADYIIYQDGKLYVRTYHTDYVFAVETN